MDSTLLRFDQLTTGYGTGRHSHVVSHRLSGSLPAASVTALVGTNGAGKSTLLRTIAGLLPPLSGDVCWAGRHIADCDRRTLARTVAVVLTMRPSAEGLTARAVVELGRLPHTGFGGRLSAADHDIVMHVLQLTGTTAIADRPIASLSDGELQRVMIAKALAQETPAILLDEPTAFLDFPAKVAVLQLLCRLTQELGKTVLLSTHDLELTFRTVNRLWLLTPNGLVEGSPAQLAASGDIGRLFDSESATFDAADMRFRIVTPQ